MLDRILNVAENTLPDRLVELSIASASHPDCPKVHFLLIETGFAPDQFIAKYIAQARTRTDTLSVQ
jgi:hypothetical protein